MPGIKSMYLVSAAIIIISSSSCSSSSNTCEILYFYFIKGVPEIENVLIS